MVLLIFSLVGLVSFSYVSSVFAPSGNPWQKMQKNSISSVNQTFSASTADNIKSLPVNSSQQFFCRQASNGC
ncbi:MAG: hypothetical protein ACTHKF_01470 [Candidatus Nitrosocosmicus sp.]